MECKDPSIPEHARVAVIDYSDKAQLPQRIRKMLIILTERVGLDRYSIDLPLQWEQTAVLAVSQGTNEQK